MENENIEKKYIVEVEEKKGGDTYSYKGWLTSDKFLKRSFATLLYPIPALLLFYLIIGIIAMLFFGSLSLVKTKDNNENQEKTKSYPEIPGIPPRIPGTATQPSY